MPRLPVVAIVIPKVGELSRKERDELQALFARAAQQAKVFEGLQAAGEVLPRCCGEGPRTDRLSADDSGDRGGATATVRSEPTASALPHATHQQRSKRRGKFRLSGSSKAPSAIGAHRASTATLQISLGHRLPDVRVGRGHEGRWNAAHHPFTSPHERGHDSWTSDPGAVRALAYDIVLNGTELGSGSIRIHRQEVQAKIFKALGMTPTSSRRASASSWKRCSTARRRTAASRWGSTAS